MSTAVFFAHLRREARGGGRRLIFFVACLAAGVAAVVAVAGFSEGLDRGIRGEARSLLAADLAIRGQRPIPDRLTAAVDRIAGARRVEVREMLTMAAAAGAEKPSGQPPRSILVELKSVEGAYPFYGELELEPAGRLSDLLDRRSVVVAPEILDRLGLAVGDQLAIGGKSFRIAGTVGREPDRITGALRLGPRLLVSAAGLERAALERLGSRVTYRTLVRLPPEREADIDAIVEDLGGLLAADGRHRIETFSQAQPSLRKSFERIAGYLALAALLSLLIGGVGVTQTVRAWLAGRMNAIAVLKCLGYRPREVLRLYLGQTAVLSLVGSLAGVVAGVAVQLAATRLLAGALPVEHLSPWQPLAWGRGLVLGVGVALTAGLPPLVAGSRVSPMRVLRRDAEPLPPSPWAVALSVAVPLAGLGALAVWQAGSLVRGLLFTGGLVAAAVLLGLAAAMLSRLAARLAGRPRPAGRSGGGRGGGSGDGPRAGLWLRYGLAALGRKGASTTSGIVALGLGVLVLLGMFLVERGLAAELAKDLPKNAPTAFLIDVQSDQWSSVEALLLRHQASNVASVPMVMARLAAIDGRDAEKLQAEASASSLSRASPEGASPEGTSPEGASPEGANQGQRRQRWALRREQRLTYLDALPEGNKIIDSSAPGTATNDNPWVDDRLDEISVESEFAADLGVGLGSVLTLDIQGIDLDLTITSLREVDWGTFGINFFLVVEPGVLEHAPQSRFAAARLPEGGEQLLQDALAAAFPNVTVVRTREVLDKIASTLSRLALGVRLLGGLTVLAGLAILAGAVSAAQVRRGAEVALLKTLGMTRRQVVATFATEYALSGLVAGLIGSAGAAALAWLTLTQGMELTWHAEPLWLVAAVAATVVLSVAAGLAASVEALGKRPVEVLRGVSG